nr:uncharacterized protein LOC108063796 [Drosophila takahashii]
MWMQLGCRAFIKGAKKRLLKRKDDDGEPTLRISDDEIDDESSHKYFASDKIQLPSGRDENCNKFDSVYLTNPSMNELMRTILTATSMDKFKRIIVSGPNTRDNCEIFHVQAPRSSSIGCHQYRQDLPNRTLSFDDLDHLKRLATSEPLLWRVRSEGNLTEEWQPVFAPHLNQSDYAIYYDAISNANSESISSLVCIGCTADFGNRIVMDCEDHLVQEPTKPQDLRIENPKSPVPQNASICYWINLAHLLLVIACLRGLL